MLLIQDMRDSTAISKNKLCRKIFPCGLSSILLYVCNNKKERFFAWECMLNINKICMGNDRQADMYVCSTTSYYLSSTTSPKKMQQPLWESFGPNGFMYCLNQDYNIQ